VKIKCIIFDLDGTLVDSEKLGSQALLDLLPGIGESSEVLTEHYTGVTLMEVFLDIEKRYKLSIPADFEVRYRRHLDIMSKRELEATSGVYQALAQIDKELCVASSAPLEKIELSLELTGLAKYFSANLYSAYEIGSWKPDPGLFRHAARDMGFEPDDCVVVEDSAVGVRAAKSANMFVYHFTSTPIEPPGSTYHAFSDMAVLPSLLDRHDQKGGGN